MHQVNFKAVFPKVAKQFALSQPSDLLKENIKAKGKTDRNDPVDQKAVVQKFGWRPENDAQNN